MMIGPFLFVFGPGFQFLTHPKELQNDYFSGNYQTTDPKKQFRCLDGLLFLEILSAL